MDFAWWCLIVGGLLVLMALAGSVLQRLPLSTSMLYLAVGLGVGPLGIGLVAPDTVGDAHLLERLTEVAVLVSLFTSGLKLSLPISDRRWRLPIRLAFGSMAITVAAVAALAALLFDLPLGAAILLGAILAPTDPVLASDVQLEEPGDRDRLRFSLTGEGGMNDGTAFPFVMLGLGLLGLHELGAYGWRWLAVDVVWAVAAGIGIGALLGTAVGRLVLYLRRTHREAVGLDDFLALGLIALSYGVALLAQAYGFLAVFAAGVALRRIERLDSEAQAQQAPAAPEATEPAGKALAAAGAHPSTAAVLKAAGTGTEPDEIATDPRLASDFMARAILGFNEQIERIGEVTVVLAIGAALWAVSLPPSVSTWSVAVFVVLLFGVVRPLSVWLGLMGSRTTGTQRALIAWFGIRGIGSMYYLTYAINHGLEQGQADLLVAITLSVVVASIVVHGVSVTPLMGLYGRSRSTQSPDEVKL